MQIILIHVISKSNYDILHKSKGVDCRKEIIHKKHIQDVQAIYFQLRATSRFLFEKLGRDYTTKDRKSKNQKSRCRYKSIIPNEKL